MGGLLSFGGLVVSFLHLYLDWPNQII